MSEKITRNQKIKAILHVAPTEILFFSLAILYMVIGLFKLVLEYLITGMFVQIPYMSEALGIFVLAAFFLTNKSQRIELRSYAEYGREKSSNAMKH